MDLVSRIQRLPLGRFHYRLLVVTGLGWMFDAMDTGLIAFIMPRLSQSWQLTAPEKAWVVSIGFVGMAIGAVLAGGIADRIGRKTVFATTLVVYSIATALCGLAPAVHRFIGKLLGSGLAARRVGRIFYYSRLWLANSFHPLRHTGALCVLYLA